MISALFLSRRLAVLALFGLIVAATTFAQTKIPENTPARNLFATLKPQVMVQVKQDKYGADLVSVTMLDPTYPLPLLKKQAEALGAELSSPPRGLQVFEYALRPNDRSSSYVKASFAVDGLINRETGVLRVQPFARAFAGVADPYTIEGIGIVFEGERPTSKTLQSYRSKAVSFDAQSGPEGGVEYRIKLISQSPSEIVIPEGQPTQPVPKPVEKTKVDGVLYGAVVIAALALGALVYSLLVRSQNRPRR